VSIIFIISEKYSNFHICSLKRSIEELGLYRLEMLLVVEIIYYVFILNLDIGEKLNSVIVLAVAVPLGALAYMIISFRSGLADEILGSRADKIRKKLKVL